MTDHPAEMTDVDRVRLRRWAGAYRRLMTGGLGKEAHTAGVDEFADESGEYPFIMADDIDCLLDALEAAEREWRGWVMEANALRADLMAAERERDELRILAAPKPHTHGPDQLGWSEDCLTCYPEEARLEVRVEEVDRENQRLREGIEALADKKHLDQILAAQMNNLYDRRAAVVREISTRLAALLPTSSVRGES